jgi:hypothetical protein
MAVALAAPTNHKKADFDFDIDIPPIEIPRIEIPDFSEAITVNVSHHGDDNDDDEDMDDDEDYGRRPPPPPPAPEKGDKADKQDKPEQRDGMRIYRMTPPRAEVPSFNFHSRRNHDDQDDDTSGATGRANGQGSATLAVKGPITFRIAAQNGDVDVVATDKKQVTVRVDGSQDVSLYAFGDRIEPRFKNRHTFRSGKIHVEVPQGSRLDVASMSGDVTARGLAEAKLRTLSGDVHLSQMGKLDVQSISGDVQIDDASGPVRLHTVSGKATLSMPRGANPQVDFTSASGSLDFKGACGRDCHFSAETVSGDLKLALASQSSFQLNYSSHSGELRDGLDLSVNQRGSRRHARNTLQGTYGKGEGVIDADAFSGNLVLVKQ